MITNQIIIPKVFPTTIAVTANIIRIIIGILYLFLIFAIFDLKRIGKRIIVIGKKDPTK